MNKLLFLYRLVKHVSILLFVLFPLEVLGWLILLPVCYLNGTSIDPLPRWLRWYDNADQFVGRDTSTYFKVCRTGWWNRYVWLGWRNPLNYLGYVVLGAMIPATLKSDTGPTVGTQIGDATNKKEGFYYREIVTPDDKSYYEYYYIHKWSETTCLRFRLGYKLGQNADCSGATQWVLVLQPRKSYSGI